MQIQSEAQMQLAQVEHIIKLGEINARDSNEIIDTLYDASDVIAGRVYFSFDDIVTPRAGYAQPNVGVPHVVIRQRRLRRNRNGWGTPEYGKMADLLVAYVAPTGDIVTKWLESWTFERWDSEKHGDNYDKRAQAAKEGLATLKTNAKTLRDAIEADAKERASAAAAAGSPDEPKVIASGTTGDADLSPATSGASIPAAPTPTPGPADASAPEGESVAKPADDANAVDTVNPAGGASTEPNPTTAL